MRLYLLSVSDCGVGVLFYQYPVQKVLSGTNGFKTTFHSLFYQVQGIWIYVEGLDPFGVEFSTG